MLRRLPASVLSQVAFKVQVGTTSTEQVIGTSNIFQREKKREKVKK
jgi:hypothetical protein